MEKVVKCDEKANFWNFSPGFIGLNLLIAFVITFVSCPSCYTSVAGLKQIWDSFLISFLISVALSYGSAQFERYFNERIPWIQYPAKRFIFETVAYMTYAFCTSYILIVLFILFVRRSKTFDSMPWRLILFDTKMPMILAFFITASIISRSFLLEWRKAAIEAEQLKTERFAQQYQSLKDQLNPHFLFNSLNVLNNLVYDNPDTASRFIRQLSKIYRYVLDVQHEELVPLDREIEFAENYLSLQKIRFEEGLQYKIKVGKNTDHYLPPLSLQLLLENAIKHNVASMANPLHIDIDIEGNNLTVKNSLQLKSSLPEESAGIGLSNIRKRYDLLSSDAISIANENGFFAVRLPLLKLTENQTKL